MPNVIGKIAANTFKPKRILGQPETVREFILGTLIGQASDFKVGKAKSPTGEEFEYRGYTGKFEYVDAHDSEVIQSGVLYLPAGIDEMLTAAVKAAIEVQGHVNVMLEVGVYRSNVPGGYSWKFNQLGQLEANDPLDEMRKAMTAAKSGVLAVEMTPEQLAIEKAAEGTVIDHEAPDADEAEKAPAETTGRRR